MTDIKPSPDPLWRRVLRAIRGRLREPSTYAGIAAFCVAVSGQLPTGSHERFLAVVAAVLSAVAAIAKNENKELAAAAAAAAASVIAAEAAAGGGHD